MGFHIKNPSFRNISNSYKLFVTECKIERTNESINYRFRILDQECNPETRKRAKSFIIEYLNDCLKKVTFEDIESELKNNSITKYLKLSDDDMWNLTSSKTFKNICKENKKIGKSHHKKESSSISEVVSMNDGDSSQDAFNDHDLKENFNLFENINKKESDDEDDIYI